MDFIGNLEIEATESLSNIAEKVGIALGIVFHEDMSGRYEEFPAFVTDVLGMEIAVLGIPSPEYQDPDEPIESYSLLVQTDVTAPDDYVETDISTHICHLLTGAGLSCKPGGTPR
jgi:hypothetical protein